MDQIIPMISDILLATGAFAAAGYCFVLARRLKRFNTLENGVGGAVAVLSAQVDDMTKTLDAAREAASDSSQTLTELTLRAESAARKLELMMASLHDLPDEPEQPKWQAEQNWAPPVRKSAPMNAAPEIDAPAFSSRRRPSKDAAA